MGLCTALAVTLVVGRWVGAQETGNCDGCAGWGKMEAQIKEWGGWIDWGKTKTGIVAVALTPTPDKGREVLAAFQEFDKLVHQKEITLCGMCKDMEKISKSKGTIAEVVPLKTGAIYMMTSNKPKTIQALHSAYDKGEQLMEMQKDSLGEKACTESGCTSTKHGHAKTKCDEAYCTEKDHIHSKDGSGKSKPIEN
jgi:hypothetical protein